MSGLGSEKVRFEKAEREEDARRVHSIEKALSPTRGALTVLHGSGVRPGS